jgi:hypothetical protein
MYVHSGDEKSELYGAVLSIELWKNILKAAGWAGGVFLYSLKVFTLREANAGATFLCTVGLALAFVLADFSKLLARFLLVVVMLLFVWVSPFVSCCCTFLVRYHFYRLNEKIKFFHCSR